ncbi:MAG: hypothetical protein ACM3TN_25755 [Alphaproteobacteria bacterium]
MITKEELASFITQVADGDYSQKDWERIAMNHYQDTRMEEARVKLVRYVLGYPPSKKDEQEDKDRTLKERLVAIAAALKA